MKQSIAMSIVFIIILALGIWLYFLSAAQLPLVPIYSPHYPTLPPPVEMYENIYEPDETIEILDEERLSC